ncbi:MAG: lipid-A-disaccharide synthase [Flammeovirgaceae bacterium]|nr:lipid-A-disaccharide synthase [Flammeovirgaceae bacterium]MDW8288112.1 lipid-A-disaccharide synthase [Flammeovirgaceae bacterium]
MKYYIIAGEKSGDLHASNLIKELKKIDKHATIRAWGGDEMQRAGAILVKHYAQMAFMGFWEVVKNIFTIRHFLKECQQDLLAFQPDVLILVDFAGFNLRMAKFAKKHHIRVFYYISPKIWAWNPQRAYTIRKYVDKMFVIMHFEKAFYQKYGMEVDYVGNPLFDAIRQFSPNPRFLEENRLGNKLIIALLPGSRKQELYYIFPTMLQLANVLKDNFQFVVAGVKELPSTMYKPALEQGIPVLFDQTYQLLSYAHAAIVTSGTATLEVALFNVPQVVCYRTSRLTYLLGKQLIRVPYISLVNLILGRELVRELIQDALSIENLLKALEEILYHRREEILRGYEEMRNMIRTENASQLAAQYMWKYLTQTNESNG